MEWNKLNLSYFSFDLFDYKLKTQSDIKSVILCNIHIKKVRTIWAVQISLDQVILVYIWLGKGRLSQQMDLKGVVDI